MADGYRRQRVWYGDISGGVEIGALTPGSTLATPRAQHRLFIQRINVMVSGAAVGTWDVQDSISGVSMLPNGPVNVAVVGTVMVDFGANGVPLTPLATLVFVNSGAGATGSLSWDGYQRLRTDQPILP